MRKPVAACPSAEPEPASKGIVLMKYVVLGAGPAGVTAAETLRSVDPNASITMIGGEPEPPYSTSSRLKHPVRPVL